MNTTLRLVDFHAREQGSSIRKRCSDRHTGWGLIGLGGAEFRLPILISLFGYAALEAVILNKAMSLVVVAFALPFRASSVPLAEVASHWPVILNLLGGSLLGAWLGAGWATTPQVRDALQGHSHSAVGHCWRVAVRS